MLAVCCHLELNSKVVAAHNSLSKKAGSDRSWCESASYVQRQLHCRGLATPRREWTALVHILALQVLENRGTSWFSSDFRTMPVIGVTVSPNVCPSALWVTDCSARLPQNAFAATIRAAIEQERFCIDFSPWTLDSQTLDDPRIISAPAPGVCRTDLWHRLG